MKEVYITGMLHSALLMIQKDLHMAHPKEALLKVNDALRLLERNINTGITQTENDAQPSPNE